MCSGTPSVRYFGFDVSRDRSVTTIAAAGLGDDDMPRIEIIAFARRIENLPHDDRAAHPRVPCLLHESHISVTSREGLALGEDGAVVCDGDRLGAEFGCGRRSWLL